MSYIFYWPYVERCLNSSRRSWKTCGVPLVKNLRYVDTKILFFCSLQPLATFHLDDLYMRKRKCNPVRLVNDDNNPCLLPPSPRPHSTHRIDIVISASSALTTISTKGLDEYALPRVFNASAFCLCPLALPATQL